MPAVSLLFGLGGHRFALAVRFGGLGGLGVRLLLRVTAAGVGLSVSHPPDWGVTYDRAGPTPSFLSTNLTRACDPFH